MRLQLKAILKRTKAYNVYQHYKISKGYGYILSPEFQRAEILLETEKKIVDLGCGVNPHKRATVAVDKYIEPIHRMYGSGGIIDVSEIEAGGCKFIEADFQKLPFENDEFDLAYSHHVVEHLENPALACKEMQRIAKKGIIMCPSIFSEKIFGREYHRWEIAYRNNTLIFIEKKDMRLFFGEGPKMIDGKLSIPKPCNPFDMLLNEGNWRKQIWVGGGILARLSRLLRNYWFSHDDLMENVFVWEGKFDYIIIWRDGTLETNRGTSDKIDSM